MPGQRPTDQELEMRIERAKKEALAEAERELKRRNEQDAATIANGGLCKFCGTNMGRDHGVKRLLCGFSENKRVVVNYHTSCFAEIGRRWPEHLGTHVSQDTQVGEIAEEQK